jgi:hypothetical protein
VLLVGEEPARSAPSRTLAAELTRLGVDAGFSMGAEWTSTPRWLRLVRRNDAVIFVRYQSDDIHFQRQLHLAGLFGCCVIRWWVGSDVYNCLRSPEAASAARELDRAVDLNIAVAAHLVSELGGIGIHAEHVPSICDLAAIDTVPPPSLPLSVLTYLPEGRKAFYGEEVLIAAIEANPDLEFIVVSDDSHALAHYQNVQSVGWVEEMETVWPRIGVLLRVTEHDGLPRMVLEALARYRYVIYSWPLAGCWLARTAGEVLSQLERFKASQSINIVGPAAARAIGADAGSRFLQLAESRQRAGRRPRWSSLRQAIRCQRRLAAFPPLRRLSRGARP